MRLLMMKISYKTLKIGWKQNNKIVHLNKNKDGTIKEIEW
jgi:hypothetical protein